MNVVNQIVVLQLIPFVSWGYLRELWLIIVACIRCFRNVTANHLISRLMHLGS